jgi:hypothetical protein
MVTSDRTLKIAGDHVLIRLDGLRHSAGHGISPEVALTYGALALFRGNRVPRDADHRFGVPAGEYRPGQP